MKIKGMRFLLLPVLLAAPFFSLSGRTNDVPRIVNIINFVRAIEPRDINVTEDVLYETVLNQAELMQEYGLTGTFLLQYDALVMPRYQKLMKELVSKGFEVGGWWEITQPHVEAAGMHWRGRYPWDWHADVGFATGYTPQEREKLVDVYMDKFHSVFGEYPTSVGSWFIDAHTLAYMHEKYGIVASCNCKDQVGTDGYTLWGGYWNQAYYPSRLNGYMPAQTEEGQIPVPIFRMLGSDPVYQYDTGLGHTIQGVITLEPVYPDAGGSETWVRRFLDAICEAPCIGFNYAQAGQENSFTWKAMGKALKMQFSLLDSLEEAGRIRLETLGASGRWFRENYRVTPPTSVTVLEDTYGNGNRTVWYDSRFYRANILWDGESVRFRDIHIFDERVKSDYVDSKGTSNQCIYEACPVLDGFRWSTPQEYAAIRFFEGSEGNFREMKLSGADVSTSGKDAMCLEFRSADGNRYTVRMEEDGIELKGGTGRMDWRLCLSVPEGRALPLTVTDDGKSLKSEKKGIEYGLTLTKGRFIRSGNSVWMVPEKGVLSMDCSGSR